MGVIIQTNPANYLANEFGASVASFDVIKANESEFADIFSEGSQELKKLLLYLWDNNIMTKGCCVGHKKGFFSFKKEHHAYIAFRLDHNNSHLRAFRNSVKNRLSQTSSSYDFSVLFGDGDVGIYLLKRYKEHEVERFFSNVYDAISYSLDFHNMITQKESFVKERQQGVEDFIKTAVMKPSLGDQIRAASCRAAESHSTDKSTAKESTPER